MATLIQTCPIFTTREKVV